MTDMRCVQLYSSIILDKESQSKYCRVQIDVEETDTQKQGNKAQ